MLGRAARWKQPSGILQGQETKTDGKLLNHTQPRDDEYVCESILNLFYMMMVMVMCHQQNIEFT